MNFSLTAIFFLFLKIYFRVLENTISRCGFSNVMIALNRARPQQLGNTFGSINGIGY